MAGRTPGAQETWQETTSHSLLHNYASMLPWIDIYTANIAFPPLALHPCLLPGLDTGSKSPARTALEGQSRDLHGGGVLRGWISVAMELQGEQLETDWSAGEAWKAKGGEERRETLICTATAYTSLHPAGTSVASLCLHLCIPAHTLPTPPIPGNTSPLTPYPDRPV